MKSIFEYKCYKDYLKSIVSAYRGRGLIGKLAEAAGCDRTYMSQALNSKVQLTADHAAGISQLLSLENEEQDYFLNLMLYARAVSPKAKMYFEKKLRLIAENQTRITEKIEKMNVDHLNVEFENIYYSDSVYSLVHLLTAIKKYQSPESIAHAIKRPLEQALKILETLRSMGLVKKIDFKFIHSGKSIHLKRGTVYNKINHLHWRLKAVENANDEDSIHFSTVSAVSEKDLLKLRQLISEFIQKQQVYIEKSDSEKLVVFCCDFFSPIGG